MRRRHLIGFGSADHLVGFGAVRSASLVGSPSRFHGVAPVRASLPYSPSSQRYDLGSVPPTKIGPFKGPKDTLLSMERMALGPRGEQSPVVRRFTEAVVRDVFPKDYLGEIRAIRNVLVQPSPMRPGTPLFRYMNDPRHVEWIKDPQRIVEEIERFGTTAIDCLPEGTLLLTRDFRFVPIEAIIPGTEIWGLDGWTKVRALAYKGVLPVTAVGMNNGSAFLATADHRVVIRKCVKHDEDWAHWKDGTEACRCQERELAEIRVRDLQYDMVLAAPDRIEFGTERLNPDQALIEGLYVADGWWQPSAFHISGKDGFPKEQQKREVQKVCTRLGYKTTWHEKSIYISAGREWSERIRTMGRRAPEKRFLSINLTKDAAAESLRGVLADSKINTGAESRTFTTTSKQLMLQVRVLHKMFGISCGLMYIENHGGLGLNPIWRLGTRVSERARKRLLRVNDLLPDVLEVPCYDIQTDSGYVYLPEDDVTVHNCDEYVTLASAMALQLGREVELVALGFQPRQLTHVGCRVKEPKSGKWIWIDPVAGPREAEAAQRAKEILYHSLD